MAKANRNYIEGILADVAKEVGISLRAFRAVIGIESNFNPNTKTKGKGTYKGLGQLSTSEFKKWGGGNIWNPKDNAMATAKKYKAESAYFQQQFGREPQPADIYMMHQQGRGGYAQHMAQPDRAAWKSMHATAEGRRKGAGWSKKAIWGNLPPSQKKRFGSVENVTSRDFTNFWKNDVNRRMGIEKDLGFDPSAARSPAMPEKGMRIPERRSDVLGVGSPAEASDTVPLPTSRREAGAKFQYQLAQEPDLNTVQALQYPDQNVVMVGGGEEPPPIPSRRNLTEETNSSPTNTTSRSAAIPQHERSPTQRWSGAREPISMPPAQRQLNDQPQIGAGQPGISGNPGGFTPELLNRTFGEPFGELFANKMGGGDMPGPIPMFSDFFSSAPQQHIQPGRQFFHSVFGF